MTDEEHRRESAAVREAVLQFLTSRQGVSMTELVAEFEKRGISERASRAAAQHLIECGPISVDVNFHMHWSEKQQLDWESRGRP